MLSISRSVTELRNGKWSLIDLTKAVNALGDTIVKYKRNDNFPSIEMALKLAKIFDVSVD